MSTRIYYRAINKSIFEGINRTSETQRILYKCVVVFLVEKCPANRIGIRCNSLVRSLVDSRQVETTENENNNCNSL